MRRRRWLWLLIIICGLLIITFSVGHVGRVHVAKNAEQSASPGSPTHEEPGHALTLTDSPKYLAFGAAPIQDYAPVEDYVITGRAFTEGGEPLPGTTVSLHNSRPEPFSVEWSPRIASQACDAQGSYSIHLNTPVHAYLVVRKEGFTQKDEEIDLRKPGEIQKNHFLLPAPGCVQGIVRDHNGHPAAGAYVTATINNEVIGSMSGSRFSAISQLTDTSGKYVISGLPEARLLVSAISRSDFRAGRYSEIKRGHCSRQDLQLMEGYVCSFVVKNARGEPIPHPTVSQSIMSGEDGIVTVITPVPVIGTRALPACMVGAPGYKSRILMIDAKNPPSEVVLQDREIPGALKGRVVDEGGETVPGATIRAAGKAVETDEYGNFVLSMDMMPSGISFSVSKAGFIEQNVIPWDSSSAGDVSGSQSSEIEVRLKHAEAGIYGKVLNIDGNPAKRFRITLSPPTGPVWTRDFENQQGQFLIQDIPSGVYDVTIVSLPYSANDLVQNFDLGQMEIRKGFYFGEVVARLAPIGAK